MNYVIDCGGTYAIAEIFSAKKHDGTIIVTITTQELVSLFFDHAAYESSIQITDISLVAHAGSQVKYSEIFENNERNVNVSIQAYKGATVDYQFGSFGENVSKMVSANCKEAHAEIHISGVYIVTDFQKSSLVTKQHHTVAGTTSSVVVNGVALANGRAVYEGDICIEKNASESNVHQKNKNISIGVDAQIYARPVLRVYNKDVSCSHASATGQLSPEMIIFARSRGLTGVQARKMILQGFLCGTVTNKRIQEKIIKKLESL
jgi:Fe-S cluster assembly scaffold protein SufB